ncbi:MAG: glycosyltransferase [Candidatus Micrarchaeota archaeon]|nr:glycosyltransferase [Candidatus Micrarchaeota archaeon]MDE1834342.1 glycosyltransferase [Candidatus Micrarchaeota archaeon]MDE1859851.1 glycosyltransferase [Candidatus Micrarchaeota archaeon]
MPYMSVIIPALNEQKYIKYPIDGLKKQTFRDFETIVVDGGSEDRTRSIARKHAKVTVALRKGVAAGRNKGAVVSRGKILVFIDADTKPSRALLATYADAFKDKRVVAATGPIYPLEKTSRRIRLGYGFVSVPFVKLSILLGRPSIVGSNFAVRTESFIKAGGFDPKLITYEDWDLSMRLKKFGKIVYLDDAVVHTSARRIVAWGVWGYLLYYVINMFMYTFLKRARKNYTEIR